MSKGAQQLEITRDESLCLGARPPFDLALGTECLLAFGEFLRPKQFDR